MFRYLLENDHINMTFKELNLLEPIQKALAEEGYENPTPIQEKAIPHALKGKDLLGCAQTGTGKTAAFAIPVLENLLKILPPEGQKRKIKALVLTPTRELAIQIGDSFKAYSRHVNVRGTVIFGGVSQKPQERVLKQGIDVLVATPGRLLDLMNQGFIHLGDVEFFVLDEADRMLDMGFIHDMRKVIKVLPKKRQTLFFSATMPKEIARLAQDILIDPVSVAVTPVSSTAEKVEQTVYFVEKRKKKRLLIDLMDNPAIVSALVFTRTKHGANRVARDLDYAGVSAMAIHGNKSQTARQKALGNFKEGRIRVLVATDIAARGIDVEELSHVINFDIPNIPETYVHRIGRTGRAGLEGTALSFCDVEELPYLRDIQRLIGIKVPVVSDHAYHYDPKDPPPLPIKEDRPPRGRFDRGNRNPRNGRPSRGTDRCPDRRTAVATEGASERPKFGRNDRRHPDPRKNQRNDQSAVEEKKDGQQQPNDIKKQRPASAGKPNPRTEKPVKENTTSSDQTEKEEKDSKWSKIFQKPKSGTKKGFVIKSDRYDKPRNRSGGNNRSYRGKKG